MFDKKQEPTEKDKALGKLLARHEVIIFIGEQTNVRVAVVDAPGLLDDLLRAINEGKKTMVIEDEVEALYDTYPKMEEIIPQAMFRKTRTILNLDHVRSATINMKAPK